MCAKFGGRWEHALNNRLSRVRRLRPAIRCMLPPSSSPVGQMLPPALGARICREYRCALSVDRFGAAVQEASKCVLVVLHPSRSTFSPAIPLWPATSPWLCSFSPLPSRDSPNPTAAPSPARCSIPPGAQCRARPLLQPTQTQGSSTEPPRQTLVRTGFLTCRLASMTSLLLLLASRLPNKRASWCKSIRLRP